MKEQDQIKYWASMLDKAMEDKAIASSNEVAEAWLNGNAKINVQQYFDMSIPTQKILDGKVDGTNTIGSILDDFKDGFSTVDTTPSWVDDPQDETSEDLPRDVVMPDNFECLEAFEYYLDDKVADAQSFDLKEYADMLMKWLPSYEEECISNFNYEDWYENNRPEPYED